MAMKNIISILLPDEAGKKYLFSKWALIFFIILAVIGTFRSLVHIFSADGGAYSIGGMDLSVGGANEVIFGFALWGSAQLIHALMQWLVILRYRSLVPLMWGMQLIESLLRILVGRIKTVGFGNIPPGEIQNYFYLTIAVLMLVVALWSGLREIRRREMKP
jgi:hypothetical protein